MSIPVKVEPAQVRQVTDLIIAVRNELLTKAGGTQQDPLHVLVNTSGLESALGEVASALRDLAKPPSSGFRFEGGGIMRVFAGDRPDENLAFVKASVVDSEGTPLATQPDLTYTHTSDKPNLVEVTDNGDGTLHLHYGTPVKLPDGSFDFATITSESNSIDDGTGNLIKDVKSEQVQLLPGNAAGFAGGGIQFPEA